MANKKMAPKIKRIIRRSFHYFKSGYSLATLPFAFVSWCTTLYYLAIKNIPALESIFPKFSMFLMTGALFMIPACGALGYIFIKSRFNRETFEIGREINPYALWKVQPVAVPFYRASVQLFEAHGIDTTRLREIIEAST